MVEEEIPANAHDINQARGYGDLSENFEYESAKSQQRILLKRQQDLDADIKAMKGTDFADAETDKVSAGTAVTLSMAGQENTYYVLGEWDSDEALRIIPSQGRLAHALLGRAVGDAVRVPYDSGEADATIAAIAPLPASIQEWMAGR